jgi:hypothetical protein
VKNSKKKIEMGALSQTGKNMSRKQFALWMIACISVLVGCQGYSNSWLHRQDVNTVYVEMFENNSFRRGYEYILTDAICKRIEAQTPYKIVSDRNVADTILSGSASVGVGVLAGNRWTGRPLEQEALVSVVVTWKNLKTGQVLVDNQTVYGSASYASGLGQTVDYSIEMAVNKAAQKTVELMEKPW